MGTFLLSVISFSIVFVISICWRISKARKICEVEKKFKDEDDDYKTTNQQWANFTYVAPIIVVAILIIGSMILELILWRSCVYHTEKYEKVEQEYKLNLTSMERTSNMIGRPEFSNDKFIIGISDKQHPKYTINVLYSNNTTKVYTLDSSSSTISLVKTTDGTSYIEKYNVCYDPSKFWKKFLTFKNEKECDDSKSYMIIYIPNDSIFMEL